MPRLTDTRRGLDGGREDRGKVRMEGKDDIVDDGDVVEFRFNV